MYATDFLEKALLNTFRGQNLAAPSKVYIGLFINSPGEEGTGIEINYPGYQRKEIEFTDPSTIGTTTEISTSKDIKFAETNKQLGTITHIGVADSLTGGNILAYGELTEALSVTIGESPTIFQDDLKIYMTGADGLSKLYREKLLNVFKGQSIQGFTPYIALFTGDADNGGVELAGDTYARLQAEFSAPEQTGSGQAVIKNITSLRFNKPTSNWGNWGSTVIMDSATNGQAVFKKSREIKEIKKGHVPYYEERSFLVLFN